MREPVIVSYARTGLAKAARGGFNNTSNTEMLAHAIKHAVARAKCEPGEVEDVIAGCVAGSGNVALYCIQKLMQEGAKVVTASDSRGFIHDPKGITPEKFAWLKELKEVKRGRIHEYSEKFPEAKFYEGKTPWGIACDLAFPCATQNELHGDDAKKLIANGVKAVAEGANMPCNVDATRLFLEHKLIFAPGKAANAGGVAVSGLEQSQNALRIAWSRDEVDGRLRDIMKGVHDRSRQYGDDGKGFINYVQGANIAGFVKVADAMLAYGAV